MERNKKSVVAVMNSKQRLLHRQKSPPGQKDYQEYSFTNKEMAYYILLGCGFLALVSKTFYDSIAAFFMLLPGLYFYLQETKKRLCQKRKQRLEKEFREVILSVSANLQAGYSVENAFSEAYQDIAMLYGKEADMSKELYYTMQKLHTNQQLEHILSDLAIRSQVEDIKDFAEIFQIAKRSGGDIRAVIANTAGIISDKMEVRRELETILAEKQLEQSIMRGMPFFIICYISITSRGFFDNLYHNFMGIFIMSICLFVYFVACKMIQCILNIEI